jgi:hypothetical protein|eukprot:COSAG06_NODE_11410_length_1514_cov_1.791519_1_plen_56_part_00
MERSAGLSSSSGGGRTPYVKQSNETLIHMLNHSPSDLITQVFRSFNLLLCHFETK